MLDILALNETRLDHSISDHLMSINNYILVRKDRNRSGGGVCLYIHSRNNFRIRLDINCDNQHEIINIEILKPNSKPFGICAFYRPPNCNRNFFESFECIIQTYDQESKELMLIGDLNCNYLCKSDPNLSLVKSISDTYHLFQIINEPTRVTQTSSTLIDVIITNMPDRIVSSGVCHLGKRH